ncbi:MAG: hypothetical protein H6864_09430 [Micavibrio sp.]|nr:hypothetical protein [Micavibrio sp.]
MDKKVVRASYESCLNAIARLSAYATSKPILITEVNERQDILAADDLIDFCTHARRLIENIGLKDLLYQATMETSDAKDPLSAGQIIGYLIHHDLLMIFRCGVRFKMFKKWLEGETGDAFFKKVKSEMHQLPYSDPIMPHALFQSDRSDGMRLINLVTFLQIFSEKILLEILKSNHWLQDGLFKDLDMTEDDARKLLSRIG